MALVESAGAAYIGSSTTDTTTSASFTPTANSLIVAIAACGNSSEVTGTGFTITSTFTGTVSNTWTIKKVYAGASGSGLAAVWVMDAGSAPGAGTVTVTTAPTTLKYTCLIVRQFAGAAVAASQNGNTATAEGTINTISLTPTYTGSKIVGGSGSGATGAALTANAATSIYGQASGSMAMAVFEGSALTTAATPQVLGYTSTAQAVTGMAAVEIVAAASTNATATPATLTVSTSFPAPAVSGGATVTPSTVASSFSFPAPYLTVTQTNNAEGGSNGVTVTTGNSGGVSGNAFDVVNVGVGATVAFDNTRSAHGSLSYKIATGVTGVNADLDWSGSFGIQPTEYFRYYLYFTANPVTNHRIAEFYTAGPNPAAGLVVQTTGVIYLSDATGTAQITLTNVIPNNEWFRLEGYVTGSATVGQLSLSLYANMDSLVATESHTTGSALNTAGPISLIRIGPGAYNVANVGPFWIDDIGSSSSGLLGPSGVQVFSCPPPPGPSPVLSSYL